MPLPNGRRISRPQHVDLLAVDISDATIFAGQDVEILVVDWNPPKGEDELDALIRDGVLRAKAAGDPAAQCGWPGWPLSAPTPDHSSRASRPKGRRQRPLVRPSSQQPSAALTCFLALGGRRQAAFPQRDHSKGPAERPHYNNKTVFPIRHHRH